MASTSTRSIVLFMAILLTDFAEYSAVYSDPDEGLTQCQQQNMTYDYCKSIIGNMTSMPNVLGHTSQFEAALSLSEFQPFLQIECSSHLKLFLCITHFPICTTYMYQYILPCLELCNRVQEDCHEAFLKVGKTWPDNLNCQKFDANIDGSSLCVGIPTVDTDESETSDGNKDLSPTNMSQTPATLPPEDKPDPYQRCQLIIDFPICRDMPYNDVIYPNILGHRNQTEAVVELHKYSVFMATEGPCANSFKTFLCIAYQPPCKIVEDVAVPIPPCEALCQRALSDSCLALIASFNMDLPSALIDCSRYPKHSSDYSSCFISEAEFDPLVDWKPHLSISNYTIVRCQETGCVPVTYLKCLIYNDGIESTFFPNLLGHENMEEATDELERLSTVVDSGCSDELEPFMCIATLFNRDNYPYIRLPCQNVCNRIWKSCRRLIGSLLGKRPRVLTCRLYSVEDCDSEVTAPKEAITLINSERFNLTHALVEYQNKYPVFYYVVFNRWYDSSGYLYHSNRDPEAIHQLFITLEYFEGYHVELTASSSYGTGPPTVVWIPSYSINESIPGICDGPVEISVCRKLGYNLTSYPNSMLSLWSSEEALTEWQKFFPGEEPEIPDTGCLLQLLHLLCAFMAPKCTVNSETIGPCFEFCDKVRKECNASLEHIQQGVSLYTLPCDRLYRKGERQCFSGDTFETRVANFYWENVTYCTISEEAPSTARPEFFDPSGNLIPVTSQNGSISNWDVQSITPLMTSLRYKEISEANAGMYSCKASGGSESQTFNLTESKVHVYCEPIKHSLCRDINESSYIQLPNLLDYYFQDQAELSSYQFLPLLFTNCSSDLLKLVCALYATQCTDTEYYDTVIPPPPPCSEFCENVKNTCAEAADLIGFEWPLEARCDLLKSAQNSESMEDACVSARRGVERTKDGIKLRRYDITDHGIKCLFYGWVDVQGQHAANDYCRVVSTGPHKMLSCALAGTHSESQYNYNTSNQDTWLDLGHTDTWYMKDVDGDGRDDYCRCIGYPPDTHTSCLRAGQTGFEAEEFKPVGGRSDCQYIKVNRIFGP